MLVIAGAPREALPAKGCIYLLNVATAVLIFMHADPSWQRSGSLKDINAVVPAAMADSAYAGHEAHRLASLL